MLIASRLIYTISALYRSFERNSMHPRRCYATLSISTMFRTTHTVKQVIVMNCRRETGNDGPQKIQRLAATLKCSSISMPTKSSCMRKHYKQLRSGVRTTTMTACLRDKRTALPLLPRLFHTRFNNHVLGYRRNVAMLCDVFCRRSSLSSESLEI